MWAATRCSLAGGATPAAASPPATRRARTARAVAPRAPLVLERTAEAQAEACTAAPAASASGQPAVSGSSFSAAPWQLSWPARLHSQQEQQQQQQQQAWVQGGLSLAGSAGVLPAWDAALPSASASTRSCRSSSSSSSRDSTALAASVGDVYSLAAGLQVQQLNEPPQPRPPSQEGGDPEGSGGGGGSGGQEPEKEFFANVGDAIRSLREDYPLLFVKDLNYSIYREDLTFKDPNISFHGLKTYKAIFWGLRFHGKLLLKASNVRVLRIWQPEDQIIKLRWQINATPRLGGTPGTFDGISIYRLDKRGHVYQHEVTDVQLRDPPITNPLLYGLNYLLSPRPQVQQVPCPGSWFVDGDEEQMPDMLAAAAPSHALASSASADRG